MVMFDWNRQIVIFQLLKWIALMDYFNILNERVEKLFFVHIWICWASCIHYLFIHIWICIYFLGFQGFVNFFGLWEEEGSNSIGGEVSGKWKGRVEEGVNGLGQKFKGIK